ncbi:MAG: leucine-rich repeat domain-containing protein [Oscillospiraceae bacterium]|jgi:Leucine-rich repeat (LRR) protein/predicted small lipoprotein YifL|nr:leucine-rich repeat domain-containing protein [Oscillospiraceae bacterium]
MKKKLSAMLFALTVLLTLAACGDESPAPPARERPVVQDFVEGAPASEDTLIVLGEPEPELALPTTPAATGDTINIGGMEISINETELTLMEMGLTDEDILPLQYLTNLLYLDLDGNNLTNISPLAGLVNLETLDLRHNRIRDISPLANMTNLVELSLWDNVITDISPLANLTKLEFIDLDENFVRDISPLAGLTMLHNLYLWDNDITDISPLANLTNLVYLDLDENNITDLSPLFGLSDLEWVSVAFMNPELTGAQIDELRAALPNAEIDSDWDWMYE